MLLLVGITVLCCALMAGLRAETDNDWATYLEIFQSIPDALEGPAAFLKAVENLYLEPVFALLVSVVKVLLPDVGVFLVVAGLSLWLYYSSFKKAARYPAVAFMMYVGDGFYLREFTQLRFGLAVAVGFAGLVALLHGRRWKHRWLSLLAASIHYTGIILFAAGAWVRYVRTKKRALVVSSVLLLLSLCGVFNGLVDALADLGLAPLRLLSYIDSEQDSAAVAQVTLLGQYVLLVASLRLAKEGQPGVFWVSLYSLSFAIVCVFSGFDLMRRVSFFFSPALYVLSSMALGERKYLTLGLFVAYSAALLAARFNILQPYASWL